MELSQLQNLLNQVGSLNSHYKKINELTGENFNIFRILNLESSEVRLHSAFLAELLNPLGKHGQKDIFLKLFINHFCFKNNEIDTTSCQVNIEKHTGFTSEDGLEGGRLDIVITDKNYQRIIIENKIYAGDQKNQILRYYNYANNADLLYLTLDGKEPEEHSKGNLINNTHYKTCSYKTDIVAWLEDCRKEVAIYPIVRESITQYINLIKYLTNQTLNNNMQEELNQLLKQNLEASFLVADNLDKTLYATIGDFITKLKTMCETMGLNCYEGIDFEERYTGIFISSPKWQYVNIGFQFQNYDKEMRYGIVVKKDPSKFPSELRQKLFALPNNMPKANNWWPWSDWVENPYSNWRKYEAWKAIENGEMLVYIKEKIEYLLKLTQNIKL